MPAGEDKIAAIIPGNELGPMINGRRTDIVTVLMADNTFANIPTTCGWSGTTLTVENGPNIATGPDRINRGDLMMVMKGSNSTLVQVTNVNTGSRVLTFAAGDSLNLNQPGAADGNLARLLATGGANVCRPPNTNVPNVILTRIRMVSYYIDNITTPGRPRLVRRLNNGHATSFDNNLGTVVAFDVEDLQISYDVLNFPSGINFTAADMLGTGACSPEECNPLAIRKINVVLTGRSSAASDASSAQFRNTLTSQISLRGMAFLNEYVQPQ
jgi:hypothetical protein